LSLSWATTKFHNAERGEIFTAGLYAPTVRYHNGTFYIVCTNLTGRPDMPLNEDFKPQNFIITSDDLTRPTTAISIVHSAIPQAPIMNKTLRPKRSTVHTALRVTRMPMVALRALMRFILSISSSSD
jgi:hypothetical protein